MTNHNPAEQPQGVDTASIPHTGKLEGPMQELPTQEFDKTSLAEAHEQNLLTIPDSVALEQANREEVKKDSSKKAVLGGVAAAGAIAIGVAGFALGSSGEEGPANNDGKNVVIDDTEEDNSINTPPSETVVTIEDPEQSNNGPAESLSIGYPSLESPEAINTDSGPVLLTSNVPEELAWQFLYNTAGLENANDLEIENEYIAALTSSNGGRVAQNMRDLTNDIRNYMQPMRDYAEQYNEEPPVIKYGMGDIEVVEQSEDSITISMTWVKDYSPINHPRNNEEFNYTIRLRRTDAESAGVTHLAKEPSQQIWVMYG